MTLPKSFAALRVLSIAHMGGETMGTSWSVKMALAPGTDVAALRNAIETVLADIVTEMSPWEANSSITRFNAAHPGTWHPLPQNFFNVLAAALHWAERTQGAYDPTIGEAVNLWGFGPHAITPDLPAADAVENARARSGWRRMKLHADQRRVWQPGGVCLDLNAIAKGFAVDEVVRVLRRSGVENLLVEIGGELRGEGLKPDGTPWWIELERPVAGSHADEEASQLLLALNGVSVATSGDANRCFERGGRRYSHTIDPRTACPIAHELVSVTVVAEECMTADVLATALTVLGPDEGPKFAERYGIAARFVSATGRKLAERLTPAMSAMLN